MASVNKVIILGNAGKDPKVRHMQNGDSVVSVSVATSESWKDKNSGESKENTEWHRVEFMMGKIDPNTGQLYLAHRISVLLCMNHSTVSSCVRQIRASKKENQNGIS